MDSPEPFSHGQLLTTILAVIAIIAGGVGWAMSKLYGRVETTGARIDAIRSDHVTRAEFEAHRKRVDALAMEVATMRAKQEDDRARIGALELHRFPMT